MASPEGEQKPRHDRVLDPQQVWPYASSSVSIQTLEEHTADPIPVVKGMLDTLVLRALAWAPMHGVEIIEWLETRSDGRLVADDSAVYQAVYRMEAKGLVSADWGVTASNRRARYYAITVAGRAHLRTETKRWLRAAAVVVDVLGPDPRPAR